LVVRKLANAVELCQERHVDARAVLPEVQGLLLSGCTKVFIRMAEVDRRLRGKGFPTSVPLRPIENELNQITAFIQTHVSAELELWGSISFASKPSETETSWINSWHKRNPGRAWALTLTVAVCSVSLTALGLWFRFHEKPQVPAPSPVKQTAPVKASGQPISDPLREAVAKFNDYNMAHPEVVVGVEKADDPGYNGIWTVKMSMLATIEGLAKSQHREKEVESLMELKSVISDGSKAPPLIGKPTKRTRPTS
jgi:hypothetical protein